MRRVVLYTRKDCHLCDDALTELERVRAVHPFELSIVDLDTAAADKRTAYDWEIPVVELDGKKIMKYRVDPARLTRLLLLLVMFGCGHPAPPPNPASAPVIDVGRPEPAAPVEETAATVAAEPTDCVERLVRGERLYKQPAPADEQLFRTALAAIDQGDEAVARKTLLELVENHKSSPFVPLAYLHFGELFMAEALKEPNRAPMAANFYRETMKYPPEDSSVYFYAALRLGQVEQLQGEQERALVAFKTVAEGEGSHHDSPCMTTLAAHARTGLVGSYAAAGDPSKAFDFFRPLSGDRDGQNTRTQRLLVRLADALAQRGSVGALVVIRGIVMRKPNVGICRELADLVRASSFLTRERAPELVQSCR